MIDVVSTSGEETGFVGDYRFKYSASDGRCRRPVDSRIPNKMVSASARIELHVYSQVRSRANRISAAESILLTSPDHTRSQ